MNLLDLMVKVGVDDQATSRIDGISSGIKSKLSTAAAAGVASMAAVSAAVVAVSTAFATSVGSVAEYGDSIDKMSQKMGMSAQTYQEWDAVLRHSGTSIETMKASMKTLANAAETGSEAFEQLGISQEQIASMSQEQLFEATIAALQNVEDETLRTYLAGQTLGRGATELGALLNTSAEETQAMRDRVHELGGVMSDDAVKAAARFQDSLWDMQTAFNGLKNNLFGQFLPSITTVMDGLQEVLAGDPDKGLEMIGQAIDEVLSKVDELMPAVMEKGGVILGALLQGIMDNAPRILDGIANLVTDMLGKIQENLPAFLDAAGQFIMQMLHAIVANAPAIIAGLASVVVELIGYLVSHIPDMLGAGVELFTAIITAIGQALGEIGGVVGAKIQEAIDTVLGFATDAFNAGAAIVQGIIDGIASVIGGIADAISGGLEAARELLPFSPAKKGPFSGRGWTLYSGMAMMDGLAQGIADRASEASDAMEAALRGMSADANITASWGESGLPYTGEVGRDSLLGELRAIRADLGNLKVYLDGNMLVGGIAPRMDTAIGGMI